MATATQKHVNYDKVFKLITSDDWRNYNVQKFECEGSKLTPEEINAAHRMSIVVYDRNARFDENQSKHDLESVKEAAIKFAENPHTYTDVSALLRETQSTGTRE